MRGRRIRICVLLVIGLFVAMFFLAEEPATEIDDGSTLVLEVGGAYVEAAQAPWLSRALGESSPPFVGLLSLFDHAERDSRLDAVVIVIRPLSIGWGKVGELRQALKRLSASGHRTVAYLDMASFSGSREYFLASAADEIWVVPAGIVPLVGLAAEYYFLGGLWEKLGIEFDVAKAGRYKSAVEAYTATGMSEPSREMANSLLDATNDFFLSGIAQGRDLSVAAVRAAIDQGPISPVDLKGLGLVDSVGHLDDLLNEIGGPAVDHEVYVQVDPAELGFDPTTRVALVYGSGTVVSTTGPRSGRAGSVFAADRFDRALTQAAQDPSVDAIIVRIDSPGGSAMASEEIWRSIDGAREEGKPIIASFSDLAASGGYYAASAADEIVTNDATLTGSIGVFALRPVYGGGLAKLGVSIDSLTRGEYADFILSSRPLSVGAKKRLQSMVLQIYDLFVRRVAEGREMELAEVDRVGQGRVWTGSQAYEIGLVDHLGGLHTALDRVRDHLGLPPGEDLAVVVFPSPRTLGEELADILDAKIEGVVAARWPMPKALRGLGAWLSGLEMDGPLVVPPYLVEIR